MTVSMNTSLTAIGRRLHAAYLPTLAKSLPSELQDLVAQLVAQGGKQGPTQGSIESLQSDATAVVINRGANRATD